jgi:hypothetical protein
MQEGAGKGDSLLTEYFYRQPEGYLVSPKASFPNSDRTSETDEARTSEEIDRAFEDHLARNRRNR